MPRLLPETRAGLISLALHIAAVAVVFSLPVSRPVRRAARNFVRIIMPADPSLYFQRPTVKPPAGDGGGGGDRSPLPASHGRLPRFAPKQYTPPMAVANNANPKFVMEATLVIPSDARLPDAKVLQYGDPLSSYTFPSNGRGQRDGIGDGDGGGVGPGDGPGVGPGKGGGYPHSGPLRVRGSQSGLVVLYKVEPDYSDEARKAQLQGLVILRIEVDERGVPRNPKIVRSLGLGLDDRAIEAVQQWRFRPSYRDGKPAVATAFVEVNFRLL